MATHVKERARRGANTDEPPVVVGSRYGTVVAFRAATGEVLWKRTPGPNLGMLAHGGDVVYVPTDMPTPVVRNIEGAYLPLGDERRPQGRIVAYPTLLAALRVGDGTLLWLKEGWSMPGGTHIVLDDGTLFTTAPAPAMGEARVFALNARTGETRWLFDTGKLWGITERLIAARSGRVYMRVEGETSRRVHALDSRTGEIVWSRDDDGITRLCLSQTGKLVALYAGPQHPATAIVLNAEDGTEVADVPITGELLGMSDDEIAYVQVGMYFGRSTVRAVRISDGTEMWRADGIVVRQVIITYTALYFARRTERDQLAEACALDAATGRLLWRWRSPRHLPGLLKLWGARTPQVLVFAIAQARRSLIRARDQHDWRIFVREVIHGQWRRPGALVWDVSMAVGRDHVYVGTSLGLFALNARDGHLLWHALPTTDIGLVAPGAALERPAASQTSA